MPAGQSSSTRSGRRPRTNREALARVRSCRTWAAACRRARFDRRRLELGAQAPERAVERDLDGVRAQPEQLADLSHPGFRGDLRARFRPGGKARLLRCHGVAILGEGCPRLLLARLDVDAVRLRAVVFWFVVDPCVVANHCQVSVPVPENDIVAGGFGAGGDDVVDRPAPGARLRSCARARAPARARAAARSRRQAATAGAPRSPASPDRGPPRWAAPSAPRGRPARRWRWRRLAGVRLGGAAGSSAASASRRSRSTSRSGREAL